MNNTLDTIKQLVDSIEKILGSTYVVNNISTAKNQFLEIKEIVHRNYELFSQEIISSTSFNTLALKSRNLYERLYMFDESETTLKLIRKRSIEKFISNNVTLADKEIESLESLQLNPTSKVCFICSGPYPWSAIEYSYRLNVIVTCVDYKIGRAHV